MALLVVPYVGMFGAAALGSAELVVASTGALALGHAGVAVLGLRLGRVYTGRSWVPRSSSVAFGLTLGLHGLAVVLFAGAAVWMACGG